MKGVDLIDMEVYFVDDFDVDDVFEFELVVYWEGYEYYFGIIGVMDVEFFEFMICIGFIDFLDSELEDVNDEGLMWD